MRNSALESIIIIISFIETSKEKQQTRRISASSGRRSRKERKMGDSGWQEKRD